MSNFRFENSTTKVILIEGMSVVSTDQTRTDIVTSETVDASEKSGLLQINEGIKSGESKFKVFTFAPSFNDTHDAQKCLDFWDFIEGRDDLVPAKAFKLTPMRTETPKTDGEGEENTDWNSIFEVLKKRGISNCSLSGGDKCKICDYDKAVECTCEDHFDLAELNSWDPFKKTYADAAILTDTIPIQDATTQTCFKDQEDIDKEYRGMLMDEIDELLRQLTEVTCDCPLGTTCEDEIVPPEKIDSEYSFTRLDKSICSCGRINCLCSQYQEVLAAISNANREVEDLDVCEVENCECSCLNLVLIRNYKLLLESKIELQSLWGRKVNREVVCVCKQDKCPCSIVVKLHKEIDRIFGWGRDDRLETVYCTCKDYYEKVLEKLSITSTPEVICSCNNSKSNIEIETNYLGEISNTNMKMEEVVDEELELLDMQRRNDQSAHLLTLHLNSPRESYVKHEEVKKKKQTGFVVNKQHVESKVHFDAKTSDHARLSTSYKRRKSVVHGSFAVAKARLMQLRDVIEDQNESKQCRCKDINGGECLFNLEGYVCANNTPSDSKECVMETKAKRKVKRRKQKTLDCGRDDSSSVRSKSKGQTNSDVEKGKNVGLKIVKKLEKGKRNIKVEKKDLLSKSKQHSIATVDDVVGIKEGMRNEQSESCVCRTKTVRIGRNTIDQNKKCLDDVRVKTNEDSNNLLTPCEEKTRKNSRGIQSDDLMIEGRSIIMHAIDEETGFISSVYDDICPGNLETICTNRRNDFDEINLLEEDFCSKTEENFCSKREDDLTNRQNSFNDECCFNNNHKNEYCISNKNNTLSDEYFFSNNSSNKSIINNESRCKNTSEDFKNTFTKDNNICSKNEDCKSKNKSESKDIMNIKEFEDSFIKRENTSEDYSTKTNSKNEIFKDCFSKSGKTCDNKTMRSSEANNSNNSFSKMKKISVSKSEKTFEDFGCNNKTMRSSSEANNSNNSFSKMKKTSVSKSEKTSEDFSFHHSKNGNTIENSEEDFSPKKMDVRNKSVKTCRNYSAQNQDSSLGKSITCVDNFSRKKKSSREETVRESLNGNGRTKISSGNILRPVCTSTPKQNSCNQFSSADGSSIIDLSPKPGCFKTKPRNVQSLEINSTDEVRNTSTVSSNKIGRISSVAAKSSPIKMNITPKIRSSKIDDCKKDRFSGNDDYNSRSSKEEVGNFCCVNEDCSNLNHKNDSSIVDVYKSTDDYKNASLFAGKTLENYVKDESNERQSLINNGSKNKVTQNDVERNRCLKSDVEHQRSLKNDAERDRCLKSDVEHERSLRNDVERDRSLKNDVEHQISLNNNVERDRCLKSDVEHERSLRNDVERDRCLNSGVEHQSSLKNDVERDRTLKSNVERDRCLNSDIEHQRSLKNDVERDRTLKSNVEHQSSLRNDVERGRTLRGDVERQRSLKNAVEHEKSMENDVGRDRSIKNPFKNKSVQNNIIVDKKRLSKDVNQNQEYLKDDDDDYKKKFGGIQCGNRLSKDYDCTNRLVNDQNVGIRCRPNNIEDTNRSSNYEECKPFKCEDNNYRLSKDDDVEHGKRSSKDNEDKYTNRSSMDQNFGKRSSKNYNCKNECRSRQNLEDECKDVSLKGKQLSTKSEITCGQHNVEKRVCKVDDGIQYSSNCNECINNSGQNNDEERKRFSKNADNKSTIDTKLKNISSKDDQRSSKDNYGSSKDIDYNQRSSKDINHNCTSSNDNVIHDYNRRSSKSNDDKNYNQTSLKDDDDRNTSLDRIASVKINSLNNKDSENLTARLITTKQSLGSKVSFKSPSQESLHKLDNNNNNTSPKRVDSEAQSSSRKSSAKSLISRIEVYKIKPSKINENGKSQQLFKSFSNTEKNLIGCSGAAVVRRKIASSSMEYIAAGRNSTKGEGIEDTLHANLQSPLNSNTIMEQKPEDVDALSDSNKSFVITPKIKRSDEDEQKINVNKTEDGCPIVDLEKNVGISSCNCNELKTSLIKVKEEKRDGALKHLKTSLGGVQKNCQEMAALKVTSTDAEDDGRLPVITEESRREIRRIQRSDGIVVSDSTIETDHVTQKHV